MHPNWINPSKAWGEKFFIGYCVIWISIFGAVVITEVYKTWNDIGFMTIGIVVALPSILYPLLFPGAADKVLPLSQRYWVKVSFFVIVFFFNSN